MENVEKRVETILLGGKEYTYEINVILSYAFLKYRNKIETGIDFSKADKETIDEIQNLYNKYEDITKVSDTELLNQVSPKTLMFLQSNQKNNANIFTLEELFEITSKFTGITEEKEIQDILDIEIANIGFDALIQKLANAIAKVFTSAKGSSQQEQSNKERTTEVAEKKE